MSVLERRTRVLEFVERWKGRGNEKQETQRFWIDLLQNVLDVERPTEPSLFEYRTVGGGFIDVLCPERGCWSSRKAPASTWTSPRPGRALPSRPCSRLYATRTPCR